MVQCCYLCIPKFTQTQVTQAQVSLILGSVVWHRLYSEYFDYDSLDNASTSYYLQNVVDTERCELIV